MTGTVHPYQGGPEHFHYSRPRVTAGGQGRDPVLNDAVKILYEYHNDVSSSNHVAILEQMYSRITIFSRDKQRQNPGNVIQFLMQALAKQASLSPEYHGLCIHLQNLLSLNIDNITSGRYLSTVVHKLAKLVSDGKINLRDVNVHVLVRLVSRLSNYDIQGEARDISSMLWGLGKLAESGVLRALLGEQHDLGSVLSGLVYKLHGGNPNAQDIANMLWSLGNLTKIDMFSTNELRSLSSLLPGFVRALERNRPNSQGIANALWGLGKLAEHRVLASDGGSNFIISVIGLVRQLPHSQPEAQNIANALWGLGRLAETGSLITKELRNLSSFVSVLVCQLGGQSPNSQEIANTLWGLGKLADKDMFSSEELRNLSPSVLGLVSHQQQSYPSAQGIANTLWGLGKLAESGAFGYVELHNLYVSVSELIGMLQESHSSALHIAKTLWGLGKLAESDGHRANSLRNMGASVPSLVRQLGERGPNAQDTANTLWSLVKLTESGSLRAGDLRGLSALVLSFVAELGEKAPEMQHIANTFWGLGKFVELGVLGANNLSDLSATVPSLLQQLQVNFLNAQNIENMLWGLRYLHLDNKRVIFEYLFNLLTSGNDSRFYATDSSQEGYVQVAQSCGYYIAFYNDADNTDMSNKVLQLYARIKDKLETPMNSSQSHSDFSRQLRIAVDNVVGNHGITVSDEHELYGYYFDIVLQRGNVKVAIEINGSLHYDENNKLNVASQLKQQVAQKLGYTVLQYDVRENNPMPCIRQAIDSVRALVLSNSQMGFNAAKATTPPRASATLNAGLFGDTWSGVKRERTISNTGRPEPRMSKSMPRHKGVRH